MIRRLAIIAALCCLAAPYALAQTSFYTHSLGDSASVSSAGTLVGKPGGGQRAYFGELAKAMMRQAGSVQPIHEVPLSRGLALLERDSPVAFFKVIRTRDRDAKFKWVGPISGFKTWFYEFEDRPTGIKTMDDARAVKAVCTVRGNNMVKWLTDHKFRNIVQATSYEDCVKLLEHGRVALIHSSRYRTITQDSDRAKKIRRTPVSTSDEDFEPEWTNQGYIAFSQAVPDEEIAMWQAALDAVTASGEKDRLKEMYLVDVYGAPLDTDPDQSKTP